MHNQRIQKFDANGNFMLEFGNSATFLGRPRAAAVSPINGDIYVFDGVSGVCTSRILVFDSLGVQKGTLASCGTGDGQFKNLGVLLETDASGNIYIGDPLHDAGSRILMYDAGGSFVRQWSVTIKNGNYLGEMTGIDVGPDGNIYAVTAASSYIFKYDSLGNLLTILGDRAPGKADGSHSLTGDIEVGDNGLIYVSENGTMRISIFDSNGNYLRSFGSEGIGDNRFTYPQALAFSNGRLVVADDYSGRVPFYDTVLGIDAASSPRNLTINNTGAGRVSLSWEAPLTDGGDPVDAYYIEYSIASANPKWEPHSNVPGDQYSIELTGLPAGDYTFRVISSNRGGHSAPLTNTSTHRVHAALKYEREISPNDPMYDIVQGVGVYADSSLTLTSRNFGQRIDFGSDDALVSRSGTLGSADDQLSSPNSMDVDQGDNLHIADTANRRIAKYSKAGTHISNISTGLRYPIDVALDETESHYYIVTGTSATSTLGRVDVYTIDGTFVSTLAAATITSATAVDVADDGSIYIAHRTGVLRQVAKFNPAGELLATYGQAGSSAESISNPSGVAVLSGGEVVVSDTGYRRLNVYAQDGSFIGSVGGGALGYYFHQMSAPKYIKAFNDVIYMPDSGQGSVRAYSLYEMPTALPPSSPQNLTTDTSTANSITITWNTPADDGGSPITGYTINYKRSTEPTWSTITTDATTYIYILNDLTEGLYDIQINAQNDSGDGAVALLQDVVVNDPATPETPPAETPTTPEESPAPIVPTVAPTTDQYAPATNATVTYSEETQAYVDEPVSPKTVATPNIAQKTSELKQSSSDVQNIPYLLIAGAVLTTAALFFWIIFLWKKRRKHDDTNKQTK